MAKRVWLSQFVFSISILLFFVSLATLVLIATTEPTLTIRLDRSGVDGFFDIFGTPVKLLAAGFAVFLAWIALRRMEQTTEQIEITDDNNRFNNFYKHRDELHKFISAMPLFEELVKTSQLDMRLYTNELHSYYYAESYGSFRPQIRSNALAEIGHFFSAIRKSEIASMGSSVIQLPISHFSELSEAVDPKLHNILDPLVKNLSPEDKLGFPLTKLPIQTQENIHRWTLMNQIYWAEFTYVALLVFQGLQPPPVDNFEQNFQEFKSQFEDYLKTL